MQLVKVRYFYLIHSNQIVTAVNKHFEKQAGIPLQLEENEVQVFYMVEGTQLLMAMVRQFKDHLEIPKAISKKPMATGWDTGTSKGKMSVSTW